MVEREYEKRLWQAGYLIAVSTMLHQHGCTVTAEDALRDAGITLADAKAAGLDEFDMKVLRPVFANIRWHEKYERERRRKRLPTTTGAPL